VADSIEFIGSTRAVATVELRSRVNGYLEQILFEDGATVKEGDLLFVIEQAPFHVALDAAKAELQRAEAALQFEQTEYRRIEPLVARKAVTQSELDTRAAELAKAQASVAVAQAAVRRAELDLAYTEIRAPISGRIGQHLVDVGSLVQAEQTLLAKIESIDPIHAYFNVSESDLLRFMRMIRENKLPDPVEHPPVLYLGLANESGFPHEGKLDFREVGLDESTGTALRRGVFPNSDHQLLPGMFVRIHAPVGKPVPRLLVEKRAIGADQRGDYLLVVNDKNVVELRLVKLGLSTDGMQVVEDGITENDWIVINGLQRARPGATVDPQRTTMVMETPAADEASPPITD
jgi:RND family efflux transporter MFP subunit